MELEFSIDSDKCFNYQEVYFSLPILSHIKFTDCLESEYKAKQLNLCFGN